VYGGDPAADKTSTGFGFNISRTHTFR